MTQSSVVLQCFTNSIAKSFAVSGEQAAYFVANSSQLIKTLVVLGGKEPERVVQLFESLTGQLDLIVSKGTKDPKEQETMEGMMGALAFGIGSKVDEVSTAACTFLEIMLQKIIAIPDQLFAKMFIAKLFLLDQTLLQSAKKTLMNHPDRAYQVHRIFDSQAIAEVLGQDLEAIFTYDNETVASTLRFYLLMVQCTSPELSATVCSKVAFKFGQPQVDHKLLDRLAIFFVEAEAVYANSKTPTVVGCSEIVAQLIIDRCMNIISGRNVSKLEACRCLNACLSLAIGAGFEEKSVPVHGISPKRRSWVKAEALKRLPYIIDGSFSNPSSTCRALTLGIAAKEHLPSSILHLILQAIKKFNFRTKARSLDIVDSNLLSFYKTCIDNCHDIGVVGRQVLFDLLIEATAHNHFFREASILLLALTTKVSPNEGDIPDPFLKTVKIVSKDLLQVKYHNLVIHPGEASHFQVHTKIFRVSVQIKVILFIIKKFQPEGETKKSLISVFRRIYESTHGLAISFDVREILFLLGALVAVEDSSPKKLPKERAKSGLTKKSYTIRPLVGKDRDIEIKNSLEHGWDRSISGGKHRPPTPYDSKKELERELTDNFNAFNGKRVFSATDNLRNSVDQSLTITSHADRSRLYKSAKKRVATVLAQSDAVNPNPEEPQELGLIPDISLAAQVKDWQDLPLIEKSKFLVAKRELKEQDRYNSHAYTFKPETNPPKENKFIVEFTTHDPVYGAHDPILYPFDPELETEEELQKVSIHIKGNRPFLKRLFQHSLSFRNQKNTQGVMISLTAFSHLMAGVGMSADACKTIAHRVKLQSETHKDKSILDFAEFEHCLVQSADYLARCSFSKNSHISAVLVEIIENLSSTYGSKIPQQRSGDPEVEAYLEKNQPETLPQVFESLLEL